ncbi:MAG: DUF488 domain-containing protein [Actinomycetota bacterium]|nr:DUF488 domain-containing protein [Actinomycetota bacterium]
MSRVFTVGHGTRTLDELVGVLRDGGVDLLVDVRRYPRSRRHPHFSKESLETALPPAGIDYDWRGEELGGRRSGTSETPSRHPAWRNDSFRAYADHMDTRAFRDALARLESDAAAGRAAAVMCAETLWWRCHRRLIADALVVRGVEVVHLLQEGQSAPHELHESARRGSDGYPVYDVGVTGELPIR